MIKAGDRIIKIKTADGSVCALPVSFATHTGDRCITGLTADGATVPIKCTPLTKEGERGILVKTADGKIIPVLLSNPDFWFYGDDMHNYYSGDEIGCVGAYSGSFNCSPLPNFDVSHTSDYPFVNRIKKDSLGNIYIYGYFDNVQDNTVSNIAMWNGTDWSNLNNGITDDSYYSALAIDSSDNIYAGGIYADRIKKWDGVNWSNLPPIFTAYRRLPIVRDITVDGDNLLITGRFHGIDGTAVNSVAKYNMETGAVDTLDGGLGVFQYAGGTKIKIDNNNKIVVAGQFISSDGTRFDLCVRYNGSSWESLGLQTTDSAWSCHDLAIDSDNNYYVARGAQGIQKYNGSEWITIPTDGEIYTVDVLSDGRLVYGGHYIYVSENNGETSEIVACISTESSRGTVRGFMLNN